MANMKNPYGIDSDLWSETGNHVIGSLLWYRSRYSEGRYWEPHNSNLNKVILRL